MNSNKKIDLILSYVLAFTEEALVVGLPKRLVHGLVLGEGLTFVEVLRD